MPVIRDRLLLAPLFALAASPANALVGAAGCEQPPTSASTTIYVDPVKGSDASDGSLSSPWKSIQVHRIRSDYKVLLYSGDYGAVKIDNARLSGFATIAPVPGQTPVFSTLELLGSTRWVVQGVKIQAQANGYSPLVSVAGNNGSPSANIVLDHINASSADDVSAWSQADWLAKGRYFAVNVDGGDANSSGVNCIAITDWTIKNVRWGIGVTGNNILVNHNTINNFGDDAIDYAGNNLVLSHNTITNSLYLGDSNHNDAMQGQIGHGIAGTVYANIKIDSNVVIDKNVSILPLAGIGENGLQGIDAFDEDWNNLIITNNVVVTNATHGLSFYSIHNSLIANNTVLATTANGTWLGVFGLSHEGRKSDHVTVRNNIISNLANDFYDPTITFDHNLVGVMIAWWVTGQAQWLKAPGTYPGQNVIDPNGLSTTFLRLDIPNASYDLHPAARSLAIGTGNPIAPAGIDGQPRTHPVNLGAY
ncbi:MAG TPA: hypothetical protein VNW15_04380 [Rhizomicrobium sp.]|jgi:hypothetical protein|nr:hypothetical protein [Rhizomicrobium sp.]